VALVPGSDPLPAPAVGRDGSVSSIRLMELASAVAGPVDDHEPHTRNSGGPPPLSVTVDPGLPPLAWCLRSSLSARRASVRCGSSVETRADRCFEGAWAGPFASGRIERASLMCGSGAIVGSEGVLGVTPSALGERLHLLLANDLMLLSNSLAFLLAEADDDVDPGFAGYPLAFERLVRTAFRRPIRTIPTARGRSVRLIEMVNVLTKFDGTLTILQKPPDPPFHDFDSYVATLRHSIRSVARNAADEERLTRYEMIQGISSGYDSAASAVLTSTEGCRRAVTFRSSRIRPGTPTTIDDGDRVATRLGMEMHGFDRNSYLTRSDYPEAEFLATGMSGEDVVVTAFAPMLARAVYCTGYLGGDVWGLDKDGRLDRLNETLDGCSLGEFRLRVDFVHLPVPTIAYRALRVIDGISRSPEMAPYSVGGWYDRPIARRLLEEAGLERGTFASAKRAVNALVHSQPENAISAATRAELRAFAERSAGRPTARVPFALAHLRQRIQILLSRAVHRVGLQSRLPSWIGMPYPIHDHSRAGSLRFQWAISRIKPRYSPAGMISTEALPPTGTPTAKTDQVSTSSARE